jgi:hypothetical protein
LLRIPSHLLGHLLRLGVHQEMSRGRLRSQGDDMRR